MKGNNILKIFVYCISPLLYIEMQLKYIENNRFLKFNVCDCDSALNLGCMCVCVCVCVCVLIAQSSLTLCCPMDCGLPGSSVHGIFQLRILEWVDIPFFRESSRPRDQIWVSCITHSLSCEPEGSPMALWIYNCLKVKLISQF